MKSLRPWTGLKRLWAASIARQLMLGIALLHAVMMTFFVFDLVSRQRDFLVEENTKQAIALAETLAANGVSWMLSNDFVGIEEVIASQNTFPGLRYALFTDLRGRVLGYTDRTQVGRYADDPVSQRLLDAAPASVVLIDNPLQVDVAQPVLSGARHIGWARVGISRESIASNLQVVTREGLAYTLVAILIGLVFALAMARGLTRDIRRLAAFANHIRSGARHEQADVDRPDELGELAHDMQRMLADLNDRERELDAAHRQIHANEERLRFALEGSTDGLWDWDLLSDQVYFSPRWKGMLGFADEELANSFETWRDLVHPDDLQPALDALERHLANPQTPFEILHRVRHKDGSWRWVLSRGRALQQEQGKPYRMVGTHVDVTDRKHLEQVLVAEREKAMVTLHSIGDGVITTAADGSIDYLNPVAEALTGWRSEEAHGLSLEQVFPVVHEVSREAMPNPVERCLRENRIIGLGHHTLLINRMGEEISIEHSAAPIRDGNGQVIGVVLVFHDVTESRHLQRRLEHQALHDDLTGLWSRRAFDQRLTELTASALQGDGQHVLVYIDLDQFKVVNDTVGHLAGDELLKQVATLLHKQVRDADMLARLGGDEFGLLLIGCHLEQAQRVSEKLRDELAEFRFTWDRQSFQIGASFGLAVIDADLPDPNALSLADLACYSAKEKGRNRVHVYHPEDSELTERRNEMQWVARIKEALDEDRFVLYGQRILSLGRRDDDRDHIEVLVRMLDQAGRIVPPNQFIPAAERYNIMARIDQLVLRKSFEWLLRAENADTSLAINLSGGSLGNSALLGDIEQQIAEHPQLAGRLCFEITETAAIANLRDALVFMERLKRRKVKFALDDFGSGLSSFNYLKTLPVDYIKIDGSFIRDLLDDPVDAAMVESISRVSRQMQIQTIAEFVESDALLQRIREMDIDYAQGYAIDKPHPI